MQLEELVMRLKVTLPHATYLEVENVKQLVVETHQGSIGLLPRRLDIVTVVVPGILWFETETGRENYVALDTGVLVKRGFDVLVSVRNAIHGTDLRHLRDETKAQFVRLDEHEKNVRAGLAKLESTFARRFVELKRLWTN